MDVENINHILEKVDQKLRVTSRRIGDSIPYTTGKDGKYDDRFAELPNAWTNGFYPGLLWLMYEQTGRNDYRRYAEQIGEKLFRIFERPSELHHDMGFLFSLSSVKEYELTGNERAKETGLLAAMVLASRYNIKGRYIRAWQGEGVKGTFGIIDCMMNIPLLYWASEIEQDARYKNIADSYAHTVMKSHIREDGSVNHIVSFDPETGEILKSYGGQGYGDGSSWSRGQAWALNGYAQCYEWTKDPSYLSTAKRVAHYFISSLGEDFIPLCDFRQPKEPHIVDSSAGMIAASGLVSIAEAAEEYEKSLYLDAAVKLVETYDEKLCNYGLDSEELVPMGTVDYHMEEGIHIPLIYSDYYFVETLCKLKAYFERQREND